MPPPCFGLPVSAANMRPRDERSFEGLDAETDEPDPATVGPTVAELPVADADTVADTKLLGVALAVGVNTALEVTGAEVVGVASVEVSVEAVVAGADAVVGGGGGAAVVEAIVTVGVSDIGTDGVTTDDGKALGTERLGTGTLDVGSAEARVAGPVTARVTTPTITTIPTAAAAIVTIRADEPRITAPPVSVRA